MRQMHRQEDYLSFASDSPLAEIDDDETYGDYLKRLGVPRSLQLTLGGPLKMVLGDPEPAGQALMRAYIGETMLSSGTVYMPERGIGSFNAALAAACADAIRVSTPVRRIVVADGAATGVVTGGETIEADAVICAVPGTQVPDLVPELPAETRRALGTVSYSTGCRVVIGLDRSPLPAGWHGALYPEDDDAPLLLDRSAFLPGCAPAGHGLLDLLIGRDRARELIPLDDEEVKRQMLGAAAAMLPPARPFPATTRACSSASTAGRRRCAWAHRGCSPRWRRSRDSSQATSTICSWRATTWGSRRSTARSPAATKPQPKPQTSCHPAPPRPRPERRPRTSTGRLASALWG